MCDLLTNSLREEIEQVNQRLGLDASQQPHLSVSIKTSWQCPSYEPEEILLLGSMNKDTGQIPTAEDWIPLRLAPLHALLTSPSAESEDGVTSLGYCQIRREGSPELASFMHVAFPQKYVCLATPPYLLAAFSVYSYEEICGWYSQKTAVYPYQFDLFKLSKTIVENPAASIGAVFYGQGIAAVGNTLAECLDHYTQIDQIARAHADHRQPAIAPQDGKYLYSVLPGLRKELSTRIGHPLILVPDSSDETLDILATPDFSAYLANAGSPVGPTTLLDTQQSLETIPSPAPEVTLIPGVGAVSAAESVQKAQHHQAIYHAWALALQALSTKHSLQPLSQNKVSALAYRDHAEPTENRPFTGEVALITGAASGIGRACAFSFLDRGCAVVGLDINPQINNVTDHPNFLGLVCDLADEKAIQASFQKTVERFGGLDMMVLNAGLFPGGCNIAEIPLKDFSRIININLSANLVLMREAFPLLRQAPRYGRVVIVGSKNAKAPGPGAVAYSTSKAAVTQLARVAALEWGSEHIRVNVIHPDAVFDTGIYTDEVLKARAAHYGISVDAYKKRNILKAEITSRDISELVAEMCGPLFRAVTGAQIQVDGGNERTI